MASLIGAWLQLLKLGGNIRRHKTELKNFYRANSVNILRREGLFDYLTKPRTLQDISDHFGYEDLKYLSKVLDVFAEDDILIQHEYAYKVNGVVPEFSAEPPEVFGQGMAEIVADSAEAIPSRLRGHYITFSDDMNLFNWDDSLQLKMYEQIRRAAFKYASALKHRGSFFDVGCGSGIGTAAIWSYYYKEGAFDSDRPVNLYALEYDAGLLQIAEDEFVQYAARHLGVDKQVIEELGDFHPEYLQGSADNLPFEDDFFDIVYTSQVIHWCDAERATKEMIRVLKPDGLFFGTEAFIPMLDPYIELYILLNEGAYGAIEKEHFIQWAKEAGAKQVKTATPAGLFKVTK